MEEEDDVEKIIAAGDQCIFSNDFMGGKVNYLQAIASITLKSKVISSPIKSIGKSTKDNVIMSYIDEYLMRELQPNNSPSKKKENNTSTKRTNMIDTVKSVGLLIKLLGKVGRIYYSIAEYNNSILFYTKAISVYDILLEKFKSISNDDYICTCLIRIYIELVQLRIEMGSPLECKKCIKIAEDICTRMKWKSVNNTKKHLHCEVMLVQIEFSLIYYNNYNKDLIEKLNQILDISMKLFGKNEHYNIAYTMILLALCTAYINGDFLKSFEIIDNAMSILLKLYPPNHLNIALAQYYKGTMLLHFCGKQNFIDAELLLQSSLDTRLSIFHQFNPNHPLLCDCYEALAKAKQSQGDYVDAYELYLRVLDMREHFITGGISSNHHKFYDIHYLLGKNAETRGSYHDALEKYEICYKIQSHLQKLLQIEFHVGVADCELAIGDVYRVYGRYDIASNYIGKTMAIYSKLFDQKHYKVIECSIVEIELLKSKGEFMEAKSSLSNCLKIRLENSENDYLQISKILHITGDNYRLYGDYAEALLLCEQALIQREVLLGPEHPLYLSSFILKAKILRESGQYDASLSVFDDNDIINKLKLKVGIMHPFIADALDEIGDCLRQTKSFTRAEITLRQAVEMQKALYNYEMLISPESGDISAFHFDNLQGINNVTVPVGTLEICITLLYISRLLMDNNKVSEASALLDNIIVVMKKCFGNKSTFTYFAIAEKGLCNNYLYENDGIKMLKDAVSFLVKSFALNSDNFYIKRYSSTLFDNILSKEDDKVVKEVDAVPVVVVPEPDIRHPINNDDYVFDSYSGVSNISLNTTSVNDLIDLINKGIDINLDNIDINSLQTADELRLKEEALKLAADLAGPKDFTTIENNNNNRSMKKNYVEIDGDSVNALNQLNSILHPDSMNIHEEESDNDDDNKMDNQVSNVHSDNIENIQDQKIITNNQTVESSQSNGIKSDEDIAMTTDSAIPETDDYYLNTNSMSDADDNSVSSMGSTSIAASVSTIYNTQGRPKLPGIDKYIQNESMTFKKLKNMKEKTKKNKRKNKLNDNFTYSNGISESDVADLIAFIKSFCLNDDSLIRQKDEILLPDLEALFRKHRQVKTVYNDESRARDLMVSLQFLLDKNKLTPIEWFHLSDTRGAVGGDGKLTIFELRDSIDSLCESIKVPKWHKEDIFTLLRFMDPSADGDLTESEVKLAFKKYKMGSYFDDNKLEKVSPIIVGLEEIMHKKQMRIKDLFSKIDVDKSLSISFEELSNAIRALFINDDNELNSVSSLGSDENSSIKNVGIHAHADVTKLNSLNIKSDAKNYLRKGVNDIRLLKLKNKAKEKIQHFDTLYMSDDYDQISVISTVNSPKSLHSPKLSLNSPGYNSKMTEPVDPYEDLQTVDSTITPGTLLSNFDFIKEKHKVNHSDASVASSISKLKSRPVIPNKINSTYTSIVATKKVNSLDSFSILFDNKNNSNCQYQSIVRSTSHANNKYISTADMEMLNNSVLEKSSKLNKITLHEKPNVPGYTSADMPDVMPIAIDKLVRCQTAVKTKVLKKSKKFNLAYKHFFSLHNEFINEQISKFI